MNKHVSITGYHRGTEVTIWRGEVQRNYKPTITSLMRLTLFVQMNDIHPMVHFGTVVSSWFNYPDSEEE